MLGTAYVLLIRLSRTTVPYESLKKSLAFHLSILAKGLGLESSSLSLKKRRVLDILLNEFFNGPLQRTARLQGKQYFELK